MYSKYARLCLLLLIIIVILPIRLLHAREFLITIATHHRQVQSVILNLSSGSNISTLDPALATDRVSRNAIQNLFLGLTDLDPNTNEIVPELATSWQVSDDGLTWTFHLRDNVMWMDYDPESEIATEIRPVVAADFEYAIKRACDPRLESYYGSVIARVVQGCDTINQTESETVTDDLVFGDTIHVRAIDDTTLEIVLHQPAAYFLSMTTMWVMNAVPHETIEEYGDEWTLPANIVTNGPYFVQEMTHGVRRVFVRNTAFPQDMWRGGNIDRVIYDVIEDGGTPFALVEDFELDLASVPRTSNDPMGVLLDPTYESQIFLIPTAVVFYFGFNIDEPPFDNVHVRRAFSAIIDRESFISQLFGNRGLPAIHLTPPYIPHAALANEIGVGFNPAYAREQMVLAGFPECEGLPEFTIVTFAGAGTWGEFLASAAEEHLGCGPHLFNIEQMEIYPHHVDFPDQVVYDPPNVLTVGRREEYPDPQLLFAWLHCDFAGNDYTLAVSCSCDETDVLIEEAASEIDPMRRAELYAVIEERLFGEFGEFPIAPIYVRAEFVLTQTWYTGPFETDGIYGGQHWDAYSIDMEAKLAGQE